MENRSVIKGMGIAVATFTLGTLGYWWFWQSTAHEPQHLEASIDTVKAEFRQAERTNVQLRDENQQLTQDNAALQTSLTELSRRVAALEDTKTTPAVNRRGTDDIELIGRVTALESTNMALGADIRRTEKTEAELRNENQQLKQDGTALQVNVVDLTERVAALEDTKTSLSNTVKSMKKQLEASIPKRDYTRVVSDKHRLVKSRASLLQNKAKLERELANAQARAVASKTMQALAKDKLALLLVTFLTTYEHHDTTWFNAPRIQAVGGQQEKFALFNYHSWSTIDAKLREMERLELVNGRHEVNGPRVKRQFTIKRSHVLTAFQTLASN